MHHERAFKGAGGASEAGGAAGGAVPVLQGIRQGTGGERVDWQFSQAQGA